MTNSKPIAILSLPLNYNYGGILQSYALSQTIKELGLTCRVIDRRRVKPLTAAQKLIQYPQRAFRKFALGQRSVAIFNERRILTTYKLIHEFIDRNIERNEIDSIADINGADYSALVIGSDQVWRYPYWTGAYGSILDAYGRFVADTQATPVISYAASFGLDNIDEYPQDELPRISALLSRFKAVSVREESGVDICAKQLDTKADLMLDPTLLLTKEHYGHLTADVPKSGHKLVTYILNPEANKSEIINAVSTMMNAKAHPLSYENRRGVKPSPLTWLAAIRDAEFVVTDSFHGCVFAIIFGKPFVAIANAQRGAARITSLLKRFGLEHHLVDNKTKVTDLKAFSDTDSASASLDEARRKSLRWLAESLSIDY